MNVSRGVVIALAVTIGCAGVSAQTAAPPNFSGTWKLDRSLSNDPAQVNFDAEQPRTQSPRARGGGGFGGFGGGGFGRGRNRSGSRDNAAATGTPEERARLAALTDQLKKGSATLIVSHHDPSFVINDAQDHTLFLETNASPTVNTLGTTTVTSTTHWDGDRIVSECAVSDRRTLVYTYTLLPKTNQMVLRVRAQFNDRSRANPPELKLVYTLARQS